MRPTKAQPTVYWLCGFGISSKKPNKKHINNEMIASLKNSIFSVLISLYGIIPQYENTPICNPKYKLSLTMKKLTRMHPANSTLLKSQKREYRALHAFSFSFPYMPLTRSKSSGKSTISRRFGQASTFWEPKWRPIPAATQRGKKLMQYNLINPSKVNIECNSVQNFLNLVALLVVTFTHDVMPQTARKTGIEKRNSMPPALNKTRKNFTDSILVKYFRGMTLSCTISLTH